MAVVTPWWIDLTLRKAKKPFAKCTHCGQDVEAIDVCCPNDETPLFTFRPRAFSIAINVLRLTVVVVALLVGYGNTVWPAYVLGVFLGAGFAGLFLRNRPVALGWFVTLTILCASTSTLLVVGAVRDEVVMVLYALAVCAAEVLFVGSSAIWEFRYAPVKVEDPWPMLLATCFLSVALAALALIPIGFVTGNGMALLGIYALIGSLSSVLMTVLPPSIRRSLKDGPISVPPVLRYSPPLRRITLDRFASPAPSSPGTKVLRRLVNGTVALLIRTANRMLALLESAYNKSVCPAVNTAVALTVTLCVAIHRTIIKTLVHAARTWKHGRLLMVVIGRRFFRLVSRYVRTYAASSAFMGLAVALIFLAAEAFRAYVHHDEPWFLPLVTVGCSVFALGALMFTLKSLLHLELAELANKFGIAFAPVAANGFFLFFLTAWSLGLIGMMTGGPYSIGWVTVSSTGSVVLLIVLSHLRQKSQAREKAAA